MLISNSLFAFGTSSYTHTHNSKRTEYRVEGIHTDKGIIIGFTMFVLHKAERDSKSRAMQNKWPVNINAFLNSTIRLKLFDMFGRFALMIFPLHSDGLINSNSNNSKFFVLYLQIG